MRRQARQVQSATIGPSITYGSLRRILIDTRGLPQNGQCPPHRVTKKRLIQSNTNDLHGIIRHLGLLVGSPLVFPTTIEIEICLGQFEDRRKDRRIVKKAKSGNAVRDKVDG